MYPPTGRRIFELPIIFGEYIVPFIFFNIICVLGLSIVSKLDVGFPLSDDTILSSAMGKVTFFVLLEGYVPVSMTRLFHLQPVSTTFYFGEIVYAHVRIVRLCPFQCFSFVLSAVNS